MSFVVIAAVAVIAVLLGLAPYIGGRIAASRQRSEYAGVVSGKSMSVRQSKYGSRTGYWLEVRLANGELIRVQVPQKLHDSTTVGSRIEKRTGDPLPRVTRARGRPAV